MNMTNKKCIYCGDKAVSRDHVPPKTLFGASKPNNLITVPSCKKCNVGDSTHDEHFRNMLSMRDDTGDNPVAKEARAAVLRSLENTNAPGLKRAILNNLRLVDVRTPGGLYLGQTTAYDVNLERLNHVARRIAIALRYKRLNQAWGNDMEILVKCASNAGVDGEAAFQEDVLKIVNCSPRRAIGERVFTYWYAVCSDNSNISAWVMQFYETEVFLCLCAPKGILKF